MLERLETQWLSSDLPASASSPWAQGTHRHAIHATAYLQMLRAPGSVWPPVSVHFAHSGSRPLHFCFPRFERHRVKTMKRWSSLQLSPEWVSQAGREHLCLA